MDYKEQRDSHEVLEHDEYLTTEKMHETIEEATLNVPVDLGKTLEARLELRKSYDPEEKHTLYTIVTTGEYFIPTELFDSIDNEEKARTVYEELIKNFREGVYTLNSHRTNYELTIGGTSSDIIIGRHVDFNE